MRPRSKQEKIETAKKLITMQRQIAENTSEIRRLDKKIEEVRYEGLVERRKLENKLKRSMWEILQITLGNRKKVEEVSHRVEDSAERLDKIEQTIDWIMKTLIGLFITTVFGGVIAYFFGLF